MLLSRKIRTAFSLCKSKIISILFPQGTLILLYHRISDSKNDENLLCVSPKNFKSQLKELKKKYRFITPEEFVDSILNKIILKNTALITFDDGYLDNLNIALPILESEKVPAIFFISTGFLLSQKHYFWDKFKNSQNRPMNQKELIKLSTSRYAYIGAHTHNHLRLADLVYSQQEQEILKSKNILEKLLNQKIKYFSYPFGHPEYFNQDSIDIVKKYFIVVFTSLPYVANFFHAKYLMPRYLVRNMSGNDLIKQIYGDKQN